MEARSWHRLLRRTEARTTRESTLAARPGTAHAGPKCHLGERLLGARGTGRAPTRCAKSGCGGGTVLPGCAGRELWRRLELRNDETRPGAVPIRREDLQKRALQFEAPTRRSAPFASRPLPPPPFAPRPPPGGGLQRPGASGCPANSVAVSRRNTPDTGRGLHRSNHDSGVSVAFQSSRLPTGELRPMPAGAPYLRSHR